MNKVLLLVVTILVSAYGSVFGQTSSFTYQGRLSDAAVPANGTYEMQFRLFDALTGGLQQPQPSPVTLNFTAVNGNPVTVTNGIFTVQLDFTAAGFSGPDRYLAIGIRPNDGVSFTTLVPRQLITSSPFAIRSASASAANALSCTLCVTDAQISAVDGSKIIGSVENANNALFAVNVSGVVAIANGGTGSTTKNFVDITTNQSVSGGKTFTGAVGVTGVNGVFNGNGAGLTDLNGANITNNTISSAALAADTFPNNRNLLQLGLLRWDVLGQKVSVGTSPTGVAFDGTNIWLTNAGSQNVTKVRVSDGAVQGTFSVGTSPVGIVFDGVNIWVSNAVNNSLTKLRASDGAFQGTFPVGPQPVGMAFDGANIWVVLNGTPAVTKLRASDGVTLGTFPVGANPSYVAFDGTNIWVANTGSGNVTKLRASDGALQGTFAAGVNALGIAFDGANIWVSGSGFVTKLRAGDGASQGTFTLGAAGNAIVFDGANIWVSNGGNVTKLRASDGALQGTYAVGVSFRSAAFDGANIWVADPTNNHVIKLPVFP